MENQWEPVILRKPKPKTTFIPSTKTFEQKQSNLLDNQDIPKLNLFTKEFILLVINKRNEYKFTREQLAVKCNVKTQIINDFENNKLNYNPELVKKFQTIFKDTFSTVKKM